MADARKLTKEKVAGADQAEHRPAHLGFLGDPGVNVLMLNIALDKLAPLAAPAATPAGTSSCRRRKIDAASGGSRTMGCDLGDTAPGICVPLAGLLSAALELFPICLSHHAPGGNPHETAASSARRAVRRSFFHGQRGTQ